MIWVVGFIILLFGFVVFRGAPYVPSRRKYIQRAFTELYPLGKDDVLVDVGSGDGIVLRIAAEHGAKAIGLELNPALVGISRWLSRGNANVEVRLVDFWLKPIPDDTTIVYGFMVTRDIEKIEKKMQQETNRLGRPVRFMTYGSELIEHTPDAELVGYHLYTFNPLQSDEA